MSHIENFLEDQKYEAAVSDIWQRIIEGEYSLKDAYLFGAHEYNLDRDRLMEYLSKKDMYELEVIFH